MKIGIMGAMLEEVSKMLKSMQDVRESNIGERIYYEGRLHGVDAVLVFSRWGKVAASSTATTLINQFDVDKLIFTGVGGATEKGLNIGDVVIGEKLFQHDMDARPFFGKFEIPLSNGVTFFRSDKALKENTKKSSEKFLEEDLMRLVTGKELEKFKIKNPKAYIGTVASGDQFISDPKKADALMKEVPDTMVVEMEGAAVAQICQEHKIPFVVIRTISDKADHSAKIDFPEFVKDIASKYSSGIVENMFSDF